MKKTLEQIAGENFKRYRVAKGLSQARIGRSISVAQTSISKLERCGEIGSATLKTVDELANYLRLPAYLFMIDGVAIEKADQSIESLVNGYLMLNTKRRSQALNYLRDLVKLSDMEQ